MNNRSVAEKGSVLKGILGRVETAPGHAQRWGMVFLGIVFVIMCAGLVVGFQVSLTIITVVSLAALIAGLRWPIVGLFGAGLLCTIDSVMRSLLLSGGLLRWNTLNYILLLYIILNLPLLTRLRGGVVRLQQIFAGILAVWLIVTPSLSEGVAHFLNFLSSFGLIVIFARSVSDRQAWFWVATVNGVLAAMGGLLFLLQQSTLPYVNPNVWALFPLAGIFSIAMAFSLPLRKVEQQVLGGLALVNVLWVFLSASRGGFLMAAVAMLFIFLKLKSLVQRVVLAVTAFCLVIMITSLFVNLDEHALHRFGKLFDNRESLRDRTSGRSLLVLGGLYIFKDNPLGVGTGGFAAAWSRLGFLEGLSSGFSYQEEREAHSGWIKVLAENGVPGILFFAVFVGSFAGVGWKKRKQGRLWIGLLVTVVLSLAFISTEFQSKALWFLASGGTILLYLKDHKEVELSTQPSKTNDGLRLMTGAAGRG